MRKTRKVDQFSEYEVEFSGTFIPGYPGRGPSMDHAGGEPPEPAEIEDLYVGVIIKGISINITDRLNEKQLDHFEELLIEAALDDMIHEREQADLAEQD